MIQILGTLVMELLKLRDYGNDIVGAAKIKIMDSQKLAKDCFSKVGLCW
jgi:hypothetical protein